MRIGFEALDKYVKSVFGPGSRLISVEEIGGRVYREGEIKGYGYGTPLLLNVSINGRVEKYVLNTIRPGGFGHEYMSDRAGILIWSHIAFNRLPLHAKSIDLGYFTINGELRSIGTPIEFFQLVEYVEGQEYYRDLDRIAREDTLGRLDIDRARALAEYLVDIHRVKGRDGGLYRRRIRELLGHGEAIMGLIDSYRGDEEFLYEGELRDIEVKCIEWRWRIRDLGHRLSQVHGDYHPWNIIFTGDLEFRLLDRSRGEWGEPADDVAALTINYIFFSLMYHGSLRPTFRRLYETFMDTYLDGSGDEEILRVIQPFYAWRCLVVASPIWYPNLSRETRRKIFSFIHNVLDSEAIDYRNIDAYLKDEA